MLAVSVDDAETSAGLRKRLDLTYPVLVDGERRVCKAFGVHDPGNDVAWPATFVVGKDGRVRWRHVEATYPQRVPVAAILAALEVTPTAQ